MEASRKKRALSFSGFSGTSEMSSSGLTPSRAKQGWVCGCAKLRTAGGEGQEGLSGWARRVRVGYSFQQLWAGVSVCRRLLLYAAETKSEARPGCAPAAGMRRGRSVAESSAGKNEIVQTQVVTKREAGVGAAKDHRAFGPHPATYSRSAHCFRHAQDLAP